MGRERLWEYFSEAETAQEHHGYLYSAGEALAIVILGSMCGLRNASQIHQRASGRRVSAFLPEHFGTDTIPCYYWLPCLLNLIEPGSLNRCFMQWEQPLIPGGGKDAALSFDGETIRPAGKTERHESPLHIISAHLAGQGLTLARRAAEGKSSEIPATGELLEFLDIEGCMIAADALPCQKETAEAVIEGKGDYALNVKGNQPVLKEERADYVQDPHVRKRMDSHTRCGKTGGRAERRAAYTAQDTGRLYGREDWENLACTGAVNTHGTSKKGTSGGWHYYICSRGLTAEELLRHARLEWAVESMHWLLDVHFGEDFCRIEDRNVQQNLNIVRKTALNTIKAYKTNTLSARPVSKIMS
jgi:predicted transposase YbfD/YdcC